jgi:hypothetical protein
MIEAAFARVKPTLAGFFQGATMNAAFTGTQYAAWLLVGTVAIAGCDRPNRSFSRVQAIGPTSPLAGSIVPQPLVLAPVAGARCPFLTPFTTAFDLVFDHQDGSDLFMEQVTIRLLDGSNVGGSPLLMSSADLTAQFGSTRIRPGLTRRFPFTPRFGCSTFLPRSLRADVVLRDGSGMQRTTQVIVPIG